LPDEHLRSALGRVHAQKLAIAWCDHLEEIQNPERVQIIHRLFHMLIQICIILFRLLERFLKRYQTRGSNLLGSCRFIVGLVFVVSQFENADFSNLPVDRIAVRTDFRFAALLIDPLADLGSFQIIDSGSSQFFQKVPAFSVCEQYSCAILRLMSNSGVSSKLVQAYFTDVL